MWRFAVKATDQSGTFASTLDLFPVDGGMQVTFHMVFPPMKGLNEVMVPLLFPIVAKPDFRKRLACSSGRSPPGDQPGCCMRADRRRQWLSGWVRCALDVARRVGIESGR